MLHRASGRWKLGLALALVTAACWATLPVALKMSLEVLDPMTLTWFRFSFAAVVMLLWLGLRRQLVVYRSLRARDWRWLSAATLLLIGNYVGYLLGVHYTSPGNAQLLIQLAPLLMALGGIWIFRERYVAGQWLGLAVIVCGLALFFADQLRGAIGAGTTYVLGSVIVGLASLSWAAYALIQKQLLLKLDSSHILAAIYVFSALLLWPFAHPSRLFALDALHWSLLGYCAVNTLVAYGAFAEALAHWQASRVSAVLATTPLLCLLAVGLTHGMWPEAIAAERVTMFGIFGASLVVIGSALSSLLGQNAKES